MRTPFSWAVVQFLCRLIAGSTKDVKVKHLQPELQAHSVGSACSFNVTYQMLMFFSSALLTNRSESNKHGSKLFPHFGVNIQSATKVLTQEPRKVLESPGLMMHEPKSVARFVAESLHCSGRMRMIQSLMADVHDTFLLSYYHASALDSIGWP